MPPDAFGRFRVLHQIGAGTLGPVFRAYEPERERLVAIKLFRLDLPPDRVHRFVDELERLVAAGLTHSGLAAPLATGIQDSTAYLVQDFVSAESLDIIVRDYGPASPVDTVGLALQLAGALDFAAGLGVHGGALHPRDVLVSPDEARLTGLGIVAALDRAGVNAPVRRPYTSPERIAGAKWDRRADVFSLAAILHEVLWGRRVAGGGSQVADALTELPHADLSVLRSAFARALAEDPADRFRTALEFATALKRAFPGMDRREPPPPETARPLPLDEPAAAVVLPPEIQGAPAEILSAPAETPAARDEIPLVPGEIAAAPVEVPAASAEATPASAGVPVAPAEISAATGASVASHFSFRSDDSERYQEVESGPPGMASSNDPPIELPRSRPSGALLGLTDPEPGESALERSRSAIWPLALALVVGLALGFAGGYGVGIRDHASPGGTPPAAEAAVPQAGAPAREYTEGAVGDTRKPAASPVPPRQSTHPSDAPAPTAGRTSPPPTPGAVEAGRLLVRSTPAGARVFVDGRDRGPTPAAIRGLSRGAHRVRLVHEGYATDERRVVITRSGSEQSINLTLARTRTPAPPAAPAASSFFGSLSVDSRPVGASVFVDGRPMGTTPVVVPQIGAGEHVVRLEHDGYRRWSSSVRVVSGEQNRITASLER